MLIFFPCDVCFIGFWPHIVHSQQLTRDLHRRRRASCCLQLWVREGSFNYRHGNCCPYLLQQEGESTFPAFPGITWTRFFRLVYLCFLSQFFCAKATIILKDVAATEIMRGREWLFLWICTWVKDCKIMRSMRLVEENTKFPSKGLRRFFPMGLAYVTTTLPQIVSRESGLRNPYDRRSPIVRV